MFKLFTILIIAILIVGCKGGGGSGQGSSLFNLPSGSVDNAGSAGNAGSTVNGASAVNAGYTGNVGGLGSTSSSDSSTGTWDLTHTPEPSTLALLGIGLAGLAATLLRKGKKN